MVRWLVSHWMGSDRHLDPVTWGVASGVLVSLLAWLFYAVTNAQTTGLTADQVISNGLLALFFGGAGGFAGGKAAPES